MHGWLAVAAASWLLISSGAHAQMKGLGAIEIAEVAKNHALDLRIPEQPIPPSHMPLVQGMLVHQQIAPDALVGLGLANVYAKRRGGELRPGERTVRSHKPAVTFVFKF